MECCDVQRLLCARHRRLQLLNYFEFRARLMLETTGVPPPVVASRCGSRTQSRCEGRSIAVSASRRAGSGSTLAKSISTRHFLMVFHPRPCTVTSTVCRRRYDACNDPYQHPKRHQSQRSEEVRRSGTIPAMNTWSAAAGPAPTSFFIVAAMSAAKTPPPKRRGQSIPWDQSPLRRDQISVKLSSPSPFTSEA